MGIQAKRESLCRIIGMVLILIGFTISIFLDILVVGDPLITILLILIEISWFFLSLFLKLEKNFFVDHFFQIFLVLSCFSIFLIIIAFLLSSTNSVFFAFISKVISNLLIIVCWHFCLSLYKKEKLIFFFSGAGYVLLSLIYGIKLLIIYYTLIPLIFITTGIVFIIISELNMKKKGLLTYI